MPPGSSDAKPQAIEETAPLFRSQALGTKCRRWHAGMALVSDLSQCRQRLRRLCPQTAGVYYWFDADGKLAYVGKAKSLRHRLLGYFQSNPSDEKMRRIRDVCQRLVWEETTHEFLALVREQEVITAARPAWNVQGQPKRQRFAFLCLSRHRAPNIYVSFDQHPNSEIYFGPILGSGRLREVAEAINHHFALRDCSDRTPIDYNHQLLLFPIERDALCLRHEIGTCLGPCAAKVSAQDYQTSVQAAVAFLQGHDRSMLTQMQAAMHRAASERRFEKAASLRDRLRLLQWVDRRLEDLRRVRYEYNCVYKLRDAANAEWWALLVQGTVLTVVPRPTRARARTVVQRALQRAMEAAVELGGDLDLTLADRTERRGYRRGVERQSLRVQESIELGDWGPLKTQVPQLLMQSLLGRWFRRQPDERDSLISYQAAIASLDAGAES